MILFITPEILLRSFFIPQVLLLVGNCIMRVLNGRQMLKLRAQYILYFQGVLNNTCHVKTGRHQLYFY